MSIDVSYVERHCQRRILNAASKSRIVNRNLGYREIASGIVCDGWRTSGVFQNGRLIPGTRLHRQNAGSSVPPDASSKIEHIDEDVVFLGVLCGCWGHVITDVIKHLWFVTCGLPERYRGLRFVYVKLIPEEQLPNNLYEIFNYLGIDLHTAVQIQGATQFRNVIVPDECFYSLEKPCDEIRIATTHYLRLIDTLIARCIPVCQKDPYRHVYFSTTKCKKSDFGAIYLDEAFHEAGYEVYYPEKMSFKEMVCILSETKEFSSTEGSCAHNSVFLPYGTSVTIVRKVDSTYWHQMAINAVRKLKVKYVDAYFSPWYTHNDIKIPKQGPFFVWRNRRLSTCLHIETSAFPVFSFCHFFAWGISLLIGHYTLGQLRRISNKFINVF